MLSFRKATEQFNTTFSAGYVEIAVSINLVNSFSIDSESNLTNSVELSLRTSTTSFLLISSFFSKGLDFVPKSTSFL